MDFRGSKEGVWTKWGIEAMGKVGGGSCKGWRETRDKKKHIQVQMEKLPLTDFLPNGS